MIVVDKFSVIFKPFHCFNDILVTLSEDVYKEHRAKISDFIAIKIFLLLVQLQWFLLGKI
jgi:hypothetical protein